MKNYIFITTVFYLFTTSLFSQSKPGILFSLQQLPDQSWGVFIKPDLGLAPTDKLLTGTGQVTIVVPAGFEYTSFKNFAGTWGENARVDSPKEARGKAYVSFGFMTDMPKVNLVSNQETLLFSFMAEGVFAGDLYLFDNNLDPFSAPNSYSTNPGNDISIADIGKAGIPYYYYNGNYMDESQPMPIFANQYEESPEEGVVIQWLDDEGEK